MDTDGRIQFANDRLAQMLRLDCAAVVGQPFAALVAPADRAHLEALLREDGAAPSKHQAHLTGENSLPLPVELSLEKAHANGHVAWCLLAVDLSRRQRAEEKLAFQAHILANVSDAVLATDPEQRITYWNAAAERLYGYSADDVMGRLAPAVVRSQATPEARAAFLRTLEAKGQAQIQAVQYDRRGRQLLILATSSVLRASDGHLLGYVTIARDITAQKRAAALTEEHEKQLQQHSEDMVRYAEDMQRYADKMRQHAEERRQHAQLLEQRVRERTAELEAANQDLQKEIAARQAEIRARQETEAKLREVFHSLEDTMLAFRESEELLRIAIEAAGMVAWTYDPEQDAVVVFARTPEWLQLLPEERFPLRGRGLELIHPDDRALVADTVPRVLAGEPFNMELRFLLPDGAMRWVAVQGRLMTGQAGKSPLVVGVVRDVTARRQANERLQHLNRALQERTSELEAERARWQGVVEGIADEVWVADADGKISLINLPDETQMGLHEFTGKTVAQVYEEVDILNPDGQLRPLEEAPLLRALKGDIVRGEEIMRHRETGRTRYRQFSAAPTRNAAGQITGSVAIVHDITEHRRLEDRLRASEQRLRRMVNVGRFGVLTFDAATGTLLDANDAFLEMTGYDRAQVEAHALSWQTMTPPEYGDVSRQQMAQLQATGHIGPYEKEYFRRDGSRSWMLFAGADMGDGTTVEYCVDINDRKRAEASLRESEAQLARDLTDAQELQQISSQLIHQDNMAGLYAQIVQAAMRLLHADMGSMQVLDPARDTLRLIAWTGFHPASAAFWQEVRRQDATSCAVALREQERVIVPDTERCEWLVGTRDLDHHRLSGIRAMQSTPLVARDGRILGIFTTHWREPHTPAERELVLLDVLARQAADLVERAQAEDARRKRETTLAQAGQIAHLGAWDVEFYNREDLNDNPLTWSDEVYRIFGYTPGEVRITNALFFERVHPDDRARLREAVAQAIATRQPYTVEHRIVRPDGVERMVQEHAEIFFDEHGRPARMVGAVQDITEQRQAQQALRESEEQLRTAALAANIGVWNWYPPSGEVKVSANWKVVFGVSPETNVTFETWRKALHPEDRDAAVNALLFAAEQATEYNMEYRVVWPDGTVRWIVDRGRGTSDESGRAINFAGVNVDITERKRMEDALAQSEARFKALYQSLPYMAVVFQKQGDEFVLTDYNQAAMPFTQGGIVTLIGKTAREIYTARPEMCEYIAQAYTEHTSLQIEGPYRLVTTGEEKYTVSTFVYVSPDRVLLHTEDITERKRAEEEIKTLARFPAENPNPVLRLDPAGRILFANSASEPVLKGWEIAVGDVVPEFLRDIVAHAFETQQGRVIEVEVRDRTYSFSIAPVQESGYVNLYGRDITDRKRAENQVRQLNRDLERRATELEIANRELESFSYSVSHDLRTPLASVRIFSSTLQDDYGAQLPEEAQHYVGMIRANTEQMEELITSLLALSRLSRQPLQKRLVNMTELAREALETLQKETERPDLTIQVHEMPEVEADPVLLKQVWVNLFANALKFTRKCGNARIEIGCQPCDAEEPVFYVRDNGVGFDMAQANKLFGVFQRLHGEEEYEGTGIGLAIVAHIVRRHGGRVWAEGREGEGATFNFTLA